MMAQIEDQRRTRKQKNLPIAERIKRSVNRSSANIFLTQDFLKFGSRSAVSAALAGLVENRFLYRVSKGIYAKTKYYKKFDVRVPDKDLNSLAVEIFRRLNIKFDMDWLTKEYNADRTQQIPGKLIFEMFGRKTTRLIQLGNQRVYYENLRR